MSKISIVCLIPINDKQVVVINKDNNYSLPNDFMQENELLKSGAIRVANNIGIDIEPFAMLGVYDDIYRAKDQRIIAVTYLCKLNNIPDFSSLKDIQLLEMEDIINGKYKLESDYANMVKSYNTILQFGRNSVQSAIKKK